MRCVACVKNYPGVIVEVSQVHVNILPMLTHVEQVPGHPTFVHQRAKVPQKASCCHNQSTCEVFLLNIMNILKTILQTLEKGPKKQTSSHKTISLWVSG